MSGEAMEVRDAAASYMPQAEQDVPPGYKRTEVGVIPADWGVSSLKEITTLMTNGFVGKARTYYTESNEGVTYT